MVEIHQGGNIREASLVGYGKYSGIQGKGVKG